MFEIYTMVSGIQDNFLGIEPRLNIRVLKFNFLNRSIYVCFVKQWSL